MRLQITTDGTATGTAVLDADTRTPITLPRWAVTQAVTMHAAVDPGVAKAALGELDPEQGMMLKSDDDKRVALFVAYPANKADTAVAADGHIDFASAVTVEKAAWNWLAKGGRLGLWHKVSTDDFETVESGIHRGPDWVTKAVDGTERRIVEGDWLVSVRAKTDAAWQLLKEVVGGASPQGGAKRRNPTPESLAQLRS